MIYTTWPSHHFAQPINAKSSNVPVEIETKRERERDRERARVPLRATKRSSRTSETLAAKYKTEQHCDMILAFNISQMTVGR